MKRTVCMILALLMLLGLCACGGSAPAAAGTEQSASAGTDAAASDAAAETAALNAEGVYRVIVVDTDGAPIPGVSVQFCDEQTCTLGDTDEDGIAVFEVEQGNYTAHILEAPEGVSFTEEEYALLKDYSDVTITLQRADDAPEAEAAARPEVVDFANAGFQFVYPEEYWNAKGCLVWVSESSYTSHRLFYVPVSADQEAELQEEADANPSDAVKKMYELQGFGLFHITSIYDDPDYVQQYEGYLKKDFQFPKDIPAQATTASKNDYVDTLEMSNDWFHVVGAENWYDRQGNRLGITPELREDFPEEYKEEAILLSQPDIFLPGIVETEWVRPGQVGSKISFKTTDFDGNAVNSEDIFAGHKVTMINIWATWCGPCKNELPELQKLSETLAEKDCQIIGICTDTAGYYDETETAKSLLAKSGATYLNLHPVPSMDWVDICNAIPTSYFVGEDGTILLEPVVGADFSKYERRIEKALSMVG